MFSGDGPIAILLVTSVVGRECGNRGPRDSCGTVTSFILVQVGKLLDRFGKGISFQCPKAKTVTLYVNHLAANLRQSAIEPG